MTSKQLYVYLGLIIIILILGFFTQKPNTEKTEVGSVENMEPPTFTWKTEKVKELNLDGVPKRRVSVEIKYENGSIQNKFIELSDGDCNELDTPDADSAPDTTIFQCYRAGYGTKYKIVKGEKVYQIMRQEFEEVSPEYNPPVQKYEVVTEVPLN